MVLSFRKIILILCVLYGSLGLAQNTLQNQNPQQDFAELSDLIDKKQFGSAYALAGNLMSTSSSVSEKANLSYYRAYCALQLENPDAEVLYQNFLLQYPEHPKSAIANFDLGNYYYQKKDYSKAVTYFRQVNENKLSKSEKTELYFRAGYSSFTQKNFEEALPWFDKIKSTDNKYTYAACYYAGYCELKLRKFQPALADLQKAESNNDYADLVPHLIASVHYQQSNYDAVIAYVPAKLEQNDIVAKGEMLQMLADSYYQKKDYKKASENFSLMMREGGIFSRELKYRVGFCHYKNEVYPDAIFVLKDVASQEDTLGQSGAYYLGLSYLQSKDKNLALTSFDIARRSEFNPKTKEEAWFLYCKLLVDKGDYHSAIESMKAFTNQFHAGQHQDEINDLLSQSYSRTKNYNEFIAWYESSKKKSAVMNKDYQRNTFFKATEHYNNEQYTEAMSMFSRSLSAPQDDELIIAANFWKGEIHSMQKDYPAAIDSYLDINDQSPEANHPYRIKAHYSLAYAYFNTKEYDKALLEFKQYIAKSSTKKTAGYDDAMVRVGDLYFEKRNYNEALNYYNKALSLQVRDADYVLFQKGIILIRQDKLPEAKSCFSQVLDKYPASLHRESAIYKKAEVDYLQSNLDQAAAGFSLLIGNKVNNHPYEPDALLKRASIYAQQGKNQEALNDYLTILDSYYNLPIHEDALGAAQELYVKLGRAEEFQQKLEQFKTRNPNSTALQQVDYEAARNLFAEQKYDKALPLFTNYLAKYPQSSSAADARYYQAECYFQTGDKIEARMGFESVLSERTSVYTGKAVQRLAEITQTSGNQSLSNNYFMILLANAKNKREKNVALSGLATNYMTLQRYDSCEYFAKELLAFNPPNTSYSNKANMMLAKSAYNKANYDKAEDYLLEIINNDKEELAAEAQYMLAEGLYKQKKYKPSMEACYQLNNNFSQYEYWLGMSYILIAENLVAQKEVIHAKSTLKSIIENTLDSTIKASATKRLEELNATENKQ